MERYEELKIEIIVFGQEDVITSSDRTNSIDFPGTVSI